MKIGIITDVHEHVDHLRVALARFRQEGVDDIVCIGDVFHTGRRIAETVELLAEAGVIGVWGNHDFGLCHQVDPAIRRQYAGAVVDFMATLRPRLEVAGCLFTHVEPWLDATCLEDLWYYDGPPDTPEKTARSFQANDQRVMFVGHLHRWLAATPGRTLPWHAEKALPLDPPERYLVVVAALCDGYGALLDTANWQLTPLDFSLDRAAGSAVVVS